MFYSIQPIEAREDYKAMLAAIGRLSHLFSDSETPYLPYRAHENIFARYFDVENNARHDNSADAINTQLGIGIGLKTWVGGDNQKVAEFGRLRPKYAGLDGLELVKEIAHYRNERIRMTKNMHGLNSLLYHVVKRCPGEMSIYEKSFDPINIEAIKLLPGRGRANSVYFHDGKHTYNFSKSKNTLYMLFDNMSLLDSFDVSIAEDPYDIVFTGSDVQFAVASTKRSPASEQLCLRLYSTKRNGEKFIPDQSGLNQWHGFRRSYKHNPDGSRTLLKTTPRNVNEIYIPYPKEDRDRGTFFPPREVPFDLVLPDKKVLTAKLTQADSKAIMSNPNGALGKWLLRDVFELPEGTKVTYDILRTLNVDSVIFTKLSDSRYSIDFAALGTYESFYHLEDIEALT
ncbi:MAG TPA: NgoFVII family restriction endonuclease [Glutamicibacter sp.]|nr:NgoFVII family restriction endonuclease [Glutamicibacter sp.]